MAITGLTGDPIHWGAGIAGIPLPDIGFSELIGNIKGQAYTGQPMPRTEQGGSNLFGENPNPMVSTDQGQSWNPIIQNYLPTNTTNNQQKPPSGGGAKPPSGGGGGGGGGGFSDDIWRAYYPGWGRAEAEADWKATGGSKAGGGGGGGGGEEDISRMISDAYAPALSALGGIESSLQTGQQEGLSGVEKTYGEGEQTIGRERGELEASLTEQGRRLAETVRGAYADALRAYNNLIQQGMSRFGMGSSAGGAVQELVNQEFLRSRGKLGQQAVQGEQDMAMEWTKMGNYITQKKTDLEQWKRGAIQSINDNFRNAMGEIAMRRGEIEANKTRDKVAALQNAVNAARQVESEDRQARMNLAQFAVQTMQELSQKAFTPQEIAGIVGQVMQAEIPGMTARASAAPATASAGYGSYYPYSTKKPTEEEGAAT